MSVAVIVIYWILYIVGDSLAKNPNLPVILCSWLPAIILLPTSLWLVRLRWN